MTPSSNLSAMTKWEIEEKDLKEIYIFRGRESERRERGKREAWKRWKKTGQDGDSEHRGPKDRV